MCNEAAGDGMRNAELVNQDLRRSAVARGSAVARVAKEARRRSTPQRLHRMERISSPSPTPALLRKRGHDRGVHEVLSQVEERAQRLRR